MGPMLYWSVRTPKFFTSELFKVIQEGIPLILHFKKMCWFRTISSSTFIILGCAVSLHSVANSGLIAGGQNSSRERQTVFFTAVDRMNWNHKDPQELVLSNPRLALYKQNGKNKIRCVGSIYSLHKRKGLNFYQTRSNAIIFYDTLPAHCISEVVVMEFGEIIYQKENVSPSTHHRKFLTKLIGCVIWFLNVVGSSKDTQTNPTKTQKPIIKWRRDPYSWINWFQDTRVVTCSCERRRKFPRSRTCEKDRKWSSIEKHIMPTCSRRTPATHSAKIWRIWSANWVMWSCVKQYQKYIVSLFSLLESRNFDWQRILKKVSQTTDWIHLYHEVCDKERTY